jgi:hypothetical protein
MDLRSPLASLKRLIPAARQTRAQAIRLAWQAKTDGARLQASQVDIRGNVLSRIHLRRQRCMPLRIRRIDSKPTIAVGRAITQPGWPALAEKAEFGRRLLSQRYGAMRLADSQLPTQGRRIFWSWK